MRAEFTCVGMLQIGLTEEAANIWGKGDSTEQMDHPWFQHAGTLLLDTNWRSLLPHKLLPSFSQLESIIIQIELACPKQASIVCPKKTYALYWQMLQCIRQNSWHRLPFNTGEKKKGSAAHLPIQMTRSHLVNNKIRHSGHQRKMMICRGAMINFKVLSMNCNVKLKQSWRIIKL